MAKKYSSKERKAYHMGRAYATAQAGKRVVCPDEKTKQSFRNGVNAVKKGRGASTKKPAQAKCTNCGAPAYIVDSDGVVLSTLVAVGGGKK